MLGDLPTSLGLSLVSYLGCSSGEALIGGWVYICVLTGLGGGGGSLPLKIPPCTRWGDQVPPEDRGQSQSGEDGTSWV